MGRQALEGGRLALDAKETIQVSGNPEKDPLFFFREKGGLKQFGKFVQNVFDMSHCWTSAFHNHFNYSFIVLKHIQ